MLVYSQFVDLINSSPPRSAYMRQWTGSALLQIMACRLFGAKPLPEPMLAYCQLDSWEQISVKFESEFYRFDSRKCIWTCRLPRWQPFCPGWDELTHWILVTDMCQPTGSSLVQVMSCRLFGAILWSGGRFKNSYELLSLRALKISMLHKKITRDDVIKWKLFTRYWPFVRGIHRFRWIPHTKASNAEL